MGRGKWGPYLWQLLFQELNKIKYESFLGKYPCYTLRLRIYINTALKWRKGTL